MREGCPLKSSKSDLPRRKRSALRSVLATAIIALLAITLPQSVTAREEEGFTLSGSGVTERSFDPISATDPAWPLIERNLRTLANCRSAVSQHAVAVRMNMSQARENGHETALTLSWPEMMHEDSGVNDLHFYLFTEDGEELSRHEGRGGPKTVGTIDLPNGEFYLCVWNYHGPNEGFTIRGEVDLLPIFEWDAPEPTPRPGRATPEPRTTPAPQTPDAPTVPTTFSEPTPTPELIATPGPDGPDAQMGIPVIAAGDQAGVLLDDGRGYRLFFGALTVLVIAGGLAIVVLRIRRDSA